MPPIEVLQPMPVRLAAAAVEVADADAALRDARRRRDRLVREAVDEGMSQRAVGAAAGLTGPRVSAILGTVDDDDDDQ